MNNKKVLIITSEFPPEPGGIGNHANNLSKYLCLNSYDVTVITNTRSDKDSLFDKDLPFKVIRTQKKGLFKFFDRIIKSIKNSYRNDIIITSGKFSLWVGCIISFLLSKKIIAIVHGSEVNLKNKVLRKSINFSLKRHTSVIAVSNFTKSLISDISLKRCNVIFNGFEPFLHEKSIEVNNNVNSFPNLITIGSVTERKGQINVINALPFLIKSYPNIHYNIVGSPIEKESLLKAAKQLKVENHITFHGIVTDNQKYTLLSQSDIFLMLSNTSQSGNVEGFGIAILEANFNGVAAIGSINCGIEDAIKNEFSGFLIDPKNTKELKIAIDKILKKKSEFYENSKIWSKEFLWSIIIQSYIKEIEL